VTLPKNWKHSHDLNQFVKLIVSMVSGEVEEDAAVPTTPAQEFARSGALRGGAARADSLTPEQRKEIARQLAAKRSGAK